jgi:hypothetical protein
VPGTPHHALGDPRLTAIATTVLAVVVVGSLVLVESRFVDRNEYAAVGGFVYALIYVVLWALVPTMFWHFAVNPMADPFLFAGIVGFGVLVLFAQGALPLYLYSRWGLRLPVVGLFVVSWMCGYLFFLVGGESGATFTLFLWSAMLAPVGIVAIGGFGVMERWLRNDVGS